MTLHGAGISWRVLSGFEVSTFNFAPPTVSFARTRVTSYFFHSPYCLERITAYLQGRFFSELKTDH